MSSGLRHNQKMSQQMDSWSLPSYEGLVGTQELCATAQSFIEHCCRQPDGADLRPPNPESLKRLLDLAFFVSTTTEEGRFPRFRLFVPGRESNPATEVFRFQVELSADHDGVQALRRLAPAANSLDHMLVVEPTENAWRCVGLAVISSAVVYPGRSQWHLDANRPDGIFICVDGPGEIRITPYGVATFRLKGGKIFDSVKLLYAPQFRTLTRLIGSALTAGKDVPRIQDMEGQNVQVALPVHAVLSHIVAKISAGGYGGTLVFPGAFGEELVDKGKYQVTSNALGTALMQFYSASLACSSAGRVEELRTALLTWQKAKEAVLLAADGITMMSRVDGCVVLDHGMNVRSFGTKILVSAEGRPTGHRLPLVDVFSGWPEDESEILALGTRHRSAFGFCRSCLNSTAIVVSQDGDIRIFASDNTQVSFVASLEADALGNPLW